ncbi:MAG: von Willebrand factor type A domain-containing protein [Salibacteraceae bacterium]|jgi:Ca-activated chloride channel homolog|nr:von Willebrand factor type A domain-containing protein [Salibacteraceae bacterium]MDP4933626.1 von Willebrand factor type A domain-containing protein [Salibacteraceae bacterium]
MFKVIQTFLLGLLIVVQAFAQSKPYILKGAVSDPEGKPLANALVVNVSNTSEKAISDFDGLFRLSTLVQVSEIEVIRQGFVTTRVNVNGKTFVEVSLGLNSVKMDSLKPAVDVRFKDKTVAKTEEIKMDLSYSFDAVSAPISAGNFSLNWSVNQVVQSQTSTESYSSIAENGFKWAAQEPLNTFSIDVDRASYSNIRRFINNGSLPPVDAVRIEEMINYFDYDYESPSGSDPVKIFTEMAPAPWNKEHQLLHVGIKARDIDKDNLPPSNLVFLLDVSGSMSAPNKLPLLKSGLKMLVQQLRKQDRVAIVVYAGAAGLVLESTPGDEKEKIIAALDRLSAGGSTAGGAGINLAYSTAAKYFQKEGNNRIILATDGDFNVGASSDQSMEELITQKRKEGVFLTVLGFGMGNYKDSKMEILADKGNGNYAYIDNISEARKTLVSEFGSTLFTVAKDVKIQVEFNPANVSAYRLIGYENRKLNNEDFNDDKKDAGEMGAGHVVTALYEIVPVGVDLKGKIDPLKYQEQTLELKRPTLFTNEVATLKLRYKEPDADQSKLMTTTVKTSDRKNHMESDNLKWSASMAQFGMLLRNSEYKGTTTYEAAISLAQSAVGKDAEGYRRECVQLMKNAQAMSDNGVARR